MVFGVDPRRAGWIRMPPLLLKKLSSGGCGMLSSDVQWSRGRVFGTFILVWALLFLFRLGYMELAFNEVRRV